MLQFVIFRLKTNSYIYENKKAHLNRYAFFVGYSATF
jgi:hypothetical protein